MSSRIRMVGYVALLLKTVAVLFSAALVRSDQVIGSVKSFKLSGNITYDCIDIYKQPSLNHPFLKTHKIQMKPSTSISRPEIKNQTYNRKTVCPDGTVPIVRKTRKTKEYLSNAQRFEEMHFNPSQASFPNTHISGVRATKGGPYRGVQGWLNFIDLNIAKDQASYASIFLGTETNFIQAGWMINPSAFGNQRVWSFGFWRGKDGKGCYNVNCPGFVQVAKDDPIGYSNDPSPYVRWYRFFIHQDKHSGNWWLTELIKDKPDIDIGYWPQASLSGSSPPMGFGQRPNKDSRKSAVFTNVEVLNRNYETQIIDSTDVDVLLDSEKCYGIRYGEPGYPSLDFYFNYGGPGGNSC